MHSLLFINDLMNNFVCISLIIVNIEDEIDVVSVNDKKLPTNPSDKDRRALQSKVANKFNRRALKSVSGGIRSLIQGRRGSFEFLYTPTTSSPIKSVNTSRHPSPAVTPCQSNLVKNSKVISLSQSIPNLQPDKLYNTNIVNANLTDTLNAINPNNVLAFFKGGAGGGGGEGVIGKSFVVHTTEKLPDDSKKCRTNYITVKNNSISNNNSNVNRNFTNVNSNSSILTDVADDGRICTTVANNKLILSNCIKDKYVSEISKQTEEDENIIVDSAAQPPIKKSRLKRSSTTFYEDRSLTQSLSSEEFINDYNLASGEIEKVEVSEKEPLIYEKGMSGSSTASRTTPRMSSILSRSNDINGSNEEMLNIVKRHLHNNMERQRRIGLKNLFQTLKVQIPCIRDKNRAPKVTILREAAVLCESLTEEDNALLAESIRLRKILQKKRLALTELRRQQPKYQEQLHSGLIEQD